MNSDQAKVGRNPRFKDAAIGGNGVRTLTVDQIKRVRGGAQSNVAAMALAMKTAKKKKTVKL